MFSFQFEITNVILIIVVAFFMQNSVSSSHGTKITMGDHYQNLTLIIVVAFQHFFMQNSVSSTHGANITMGDHYQNFIFGGFLLCIPIEDVERGAELSFSERVPRTAKRTPLCIIVKFFLVSDRTDGQTDRQTQ